MIGYDALIGTYRLPDPDDEHVVAAADKGNAGGIVTSNFKDFPPSRLPAHIAVLSPVSFAADTVSADPVAAARAISEVATRRDMGVEDVVDLLSMRYKMFDAAEILRGTL